MNKEAIDQGEYCDQVGCFGEFQNDNPVCKKYCVLSIRCAIEQDQSARMEILEDLVASEGPYIKIQ